MISDCLSKYDLVLCIETKVGSVPVYKFIEKFIKIVDKNSNVVPFRLNSVQCKIYAELCEQKMRGENMRIDVLKARQMGISTFIASMFICLTLLKPNQKAGIIADTAEHATSIFNIYKFMYANLPTEIKNRLPLEKSNAREITVAWDKDKGIYSSIKVMVQGDGAGRGSTFQYLHASECAFWQDIQSSLTSLLSTVSGTNKNSIVMLETTANGFNGYKKRYDMDLTGRTMFKALFYAWWEHCEYQVHRELPYSLPPFMLDIQKKYKLTNDQMNWYYERYEEVSEEKADLFQENPSCLIDAFKNSGNSVFNIELLTDRLQYCMTHDLTKFRGYFTYSKEFSQDGNKITIRDMEFYKTNKGEVIIYEEPIRNHPYCVNCDPALGGQDYYAMQVVDNNTLKQVAVYHKNKCDADEVAYQLYCLGRYYNNALISSETNTTSYLLDVCVKCGYENIYQDVDVETLDERYANKYGYKTKQNNRQYMIDLFRTAFRENPNLVCDLETLLEMQSFQIVEHSNGKEKIEASGGKHDDLVMAFCGIFLIRNQMTTLVESNDVSELGNTKYDFIFRNKKRASDELKGELFKWD